MQTWRREVPRPIVRSQRSISAQSFLESVPVLHPPPYTLLPASSDVFNIGQVAAVRNIKRSSRNESADPLGK
jgi:hypothetical protein